MYKLLLVFWLMCNSMMLSGQQISGTITFDYTPIIGATLYNTVLSIGTISDENGSFTLTAEKGHTISVNYLGYEDYSFKVTDQLDYKIGLTQASLALEEIVVTALGLERNSKDLGYSVQTLNTKSIAEVKSVNLLDNFSGKMAGVTITQGATGVGSSSNISIRGESSFTNNNPLFVVDGIPISNSTNLNITNEQAAGFQEVDFGNGAMDINPDDIAAVSVLKGPSAAALYGTRASNGVIVITTKDGSNNDGLGISFNSSIFIDRPFALPKFQNTYGQGNSGQFEFVDGLGGGINDNITYSYGPELDAGLLIPQYDSPVTLPNGKVVRGGDVAVHGGLLITPTPFVSNPDNLKNFYSAGNTLINNLSFSQSIGKSDLRLSLSDLRSESFIPGVNLYRQHITGKINIELSEKLKVNSSLNYIHSESDNRPSSGYGSENINYSLVAWLGRQTDLNPLKEYWQPGLEDLQQYSFNYTFFDNPYFILLENRNAFDKNRMFGNVSMTYLMNDQMSISIRSGLDNTNEARAFRRAFSSNRFKTGAYAEHQIGYREVNTDILAHYSNSFGDVSVDISAGANRMDQTGSNLQIQAIGLAQPGIFSLANAASPLETFSFDSRKRINSVYGIAKFGFKNLFYLDVTGRNDWSSALATPSSIENVSFFYPSVSASFILSKVMQLPSAISFAKLRASWAQVGNDTDPYQTIGVFSPQTPVAGDPTFSDQTFIPNNNLQPELSSAIEVGTDIRLFDDRLTLDLTYYTSENTNQILSLPIATSTGYNQQVINGGTVKSKGYEAIISVRPIYTSKIKWNAMLNFSTNRSTVTNLPDDAGSLTLAYSRVYDNPNQTVWFIVQEGGEIGDIWGTGYAKTAEGDFLIGDDGKLIVDNTLKNIGNYNPDFILGFTNQISVGNIGLNVTLDWRQGGQLVSRTQALAGVAGQLKETEYRPEEGLIFEGVINTGTNENPTYTPNTIAINPETYYRQYYDRNHEENNLYDASYLKLRELQLSYQFGKAAMGNSFLKGIEAMSVSLIGKNLFALSSIPHFDPEQLAVQGNTFVRGVEDMSYPSARSLGLSLNITL